MVSLAELQRVVDAGGPWRDGSEEVTDRVDAAPLGRLADCLDGPPPAEVVPPMWLSVTCLRWPRLAELGDDGHPREGLGYPPIPQRHRVFAGGRLEVVAPVRVGDAVRRSTRVTGARAAQTRSGPLLFVTLEHRYLAGDGTTFAREEQDLAYRAGDAGIQARPASPLGDPPRSHASRGHPPREAVPPPPAVELAADTRRLFRFSALTANTHRIHYDAGYATGAEHLPGTLVHGPLIGLLLLELPRRAPSASPVRSFEFRVRQPVTAAAIIRAHVADAGAGEWAVHADVDGTTVATGSVRFEGLLGEWPASSNGRSQRVPARDPRSGARRRRAGDPAHRHRSRARGRVPREDRRAHARHGAVRLDDPGGVRR
jgi:3-methylfumaryl-CoA hydratase